MSCGFNRTVITASGAALELEGKFRIGEESYDADAFMPMW